LGALEYPFELPAPGVCLEEFEILTDQSMREACGDTDLIERESFFVEQHYASEVLDIAFDGSLGVLGPLFDLGELVARQVEIENLSLVRLSAAHLVTPAA
jgi:hypothetical protein